MLSSKVFMIYLSSSYVFEFDMHISSRKNHMAYGQGDCAMSETCKMGNVPNER